jgi:4-hydroxy-tetrahydrodipicolinate reductase
MKSRYKLMVWGPGRMGSMCIWEIAQSKEFELVGVRTYSEKKNGIDAGEMVGIAPMGVKLTTDVEALLKIDCDCIVYTPHDMGDYKTDDELLSLLAAGKNVVTVLPYQNAHLFREAAFVEKLNAACQTGQCSKTGIAAWPTRCRCNTPVLACCPKRPKK